MIKLNMSQEKTQKMVQYLLYSATQFKTVTHKCKQIVYVLKAVYGNEGCDTYLRYTNYAKQLGMQENESLQTVYDTAMNAPSTNTIIYPNAAAFYYLHQQITEDELNGQDRKQELTYKELFYYLYRVTQHVCSNGGHKFIFRKYFLTANFKNAYKKYTGKQITAHKISKMNYLAHKHDLLKIFKEKGSANLFVIGDKNFCKYQQNVDVNEQKLLELLKGTNYVAVIDEYAQPITAPKTLKEVIAYHSIDLPETIKEEFSAYADAYANN